MNFLQKLMTRWGWVKLAQHERALVDQLRQPARWLPDGGFTAFDQEVLTAFLKSETGRKVDVAVYNYHLQLMQQAMQGKGPEQAALMHRAAGGWAAWNAAKTLSLIELGAETESTEPDDARMSGDGASHH